MLVDCRDTASVVALAKTGRYLIHVLESDAEAVEAARRELHKAGLYGIASVERLDPGGKLPYTENLVNAVFLGEKANRAVTAAEINRVLRPQGVVFTAGNETSRKPWPPQMDQWTHPRHAADGNAVSRDTLVAPPRRVRWVTGPQQEISNMVTAERPLLLRRRAGPRRLQRPAPVGAEAQSVAGPRRISCSRSSPAACGRWPWATGCWSSQTVSSRPSMRRPAGRSVEYPNAGTPTESWCVGGRTILLLIGRCRSRRSCAVGLLRRRRRQLRWKHDADDARCVVAGDGSVYFLHGDPRRGEAVRLACLDLADGKLRWQQADLPWLPKVRQLTSITADSWPAKSRRSTTRRRAT